MVPGKMAHKIDKKDVHHWCHAIVIDQIQTHNRNVQGEIWVAAFYAFYV